MTDSDRLVRLRRPPSWAGILLATALACAPPALAQDKPSLKELLGRAQSQSEKKAVEDLVEKLRGQPAAANPQGKAKAAAPAADNPTSPGEAASSTTGEERKAGSPAVAPAEAKADDVTTAKAVAPETSSKPLESGPAASGEAADKAQAGKPPLDEAAPVQQAAPQEAEKAASAVSDATLKGDSGERPSVDLEVQFAFDSARMTPQAIATLTTLGHALVDARLADDAFLIGGHTDAKGRRNYNLDLSERRAQAVRRFLIDTFRIDGSRLIAKGFGEQHLKNPQAPRAAENRRVQIVNVSKQAAR